MRVQFDLWTEKYLTCPKKGIPRLASESTFTNESLVMVLVISVVPFPVNSTSEKEGKNKFTFGRMLSLNLYSFLPFSSLFGKGTKSMSIVLLPIPMRYTHLFLLLESWPPLQFSFQTLVSSFGRSWSLLAERSSPGCLARRGRNKIQKHKTGQISGKLIWWLFFFFEAT